MLHLLCCSRDLWIFGLDITLVGGSRRDNGSWLANNWDVADMHLTRMFILPVKSLNDLRNASIFKHVILTIISRYYLLIN